MNVIDVGEKLHIVEKRYFADDVRRHFVGEVKAYNNNILRLLGYVWVYNAQQAKFTRRKEIRERLLILGDRLIINVLPKNIDIINIVYNTDDQKRMFITDNHGYTLEFTEFVSI